VRMGTNECEMSEGVMGIYRVRKQRTSDLRGICPRTITSGSKAASYV
jgi:hypothetical protein